MPVEECTNNRPFLPWLILFPFSVTFFLLHYLKPSLGFMAQFQKPLLPEDFPKHPGELDPFLCSQSHTFLLYFQPLSCPTVNNSCLCTYIFISIGIRYIVVPWYSLLICFGTRDMCQNWRVLNYEAFSLAGRCHNSYKLQQVEWAPSKHRVLKHFFLIKMWRVQGLTSSEADWYGGMTVLLLDKNHSFCIPYYLAQWNYIKSFQNCFNYVY